MTLRRWLALLCLLWISAGTVSAAEIESLDVVDSSNTARFPTGMPPGSVDDGMRAVEGILARWHEDTGCRKATTGAADAHVFAAARTLSAYYDGLSICLEIHATNTGGASTLNVDSIGVKNILKHGDDTLAVGDLNATFKYLLVYDGAAFQLLSALAVPPAKTNADNNFSTDQTFVSTDAGALEEPGIDLDRNSASPAASDVMGAIRFKGRDAGANSTTYSKVSSEIVDPTEGTEDGKFVIATMIAGAAGDRFHFGAGLYAEGNADPGVGKIDADEFKVSGTALPFQKSFAQTDTSISLGALSTFTHGLGGRPTLVIAVLRAEAGAGDGFSADDELAIEGAVWDDDNSGGVTDFFGATVWWDATQIFVRFGPNSIRVVGAPDGSPAILNLADWDLNVRAYR